MSEAALPSKAQIDRLVEAMFSRPGTPGSAIEHSVVFYFRPGEFVSRENLKRCLYRAIGEQAE